MNSRTLFRWSLFPILVATVFLLNRFFLESQFYMLKELRYFLLYLIAVPVLVIEYVTTNNRADGSYRNFLRDLVWVSLCVVGIDWVVGDQWRAQMISGLRTMELPGRLFSSNDLGPFWLQVFGYFMLVNFLKYWSHRMIHRFNFLWRFHALHHSIKEYYALNSIYNHPVDYFVRVVIPTFLSWYVGWRFDAIFTADCFAILIIWVSHSNASFRYPRFFKYLITTNDLHHWHHHPKVGIKNNFSTSVAFYDLIFGSFFLPRDGRRPTQVGLYRKASYPQQGFWNLMLYPFRSQTRKETSSEQ